MTEPLQVQRAEVSSTELTRFNALRHGVLSRYTVLPGKTPTSIRRSWQRWWPSTHRKDRLRNIWSRRSRASCGENVGCAWPRQPHTGGTLASYRETVKVALVHLDTSGQSERVVDAIRATAADTQEDIADMAADEAMTGRASSPSPLCNVSGDDTSATGTASSGVSAPKLVTLGASTVALDALTW